MACGRPVVGTFSGSILEVIGDAGVLVPPADFTALADALSELKRNDNKRFRLGDKARRSAEERFDAREIGKRLKEVFEALLN